MAVSTHSRPKAAAAAVRPAKSLRCGFNSQPPEGGCRRRMGKVSDTCCFNSQPLEGGCQGRPDTVLHRQSFNSQPLEGGCALRVVNFPFLGKFQLTAARRRLPSRSLISASVFMFQLTAARRRLLPLTGGLLSFFWGFNSQPPEGGCLPGHLGHGQTAGFNSQPPEGGCLSPDVFISGRREFQLTAARRRLPNRRPYRSAGNPFQLTAARRRLPMVRARSALALLFQLTAARRRLLLVPHLDPAAAKVSTHSRPKAAA